MADRISVAAFGAKAGADSTAALARALEWARMQRLMFGAAQPVVVPAGRFLYADVLVADGVVLEGEEGAELFATNMLRSAIVMKGAAPQVRGLRLTGPQLAKEQRAKTPGSCRVVAEGATGFVVERVRIEQAAGAGVFVYRASNGGRVSGNRISDTLADSVHVTDRSSFVEVDDNIIERSGDDGIAVVSYLTQVTPAHSVTARRNLITDNAGGRGLSVVGGASVLYEDNKVIGNGKAAGLYVAQEDSYKTQAVSGVTVRRNTFFRCGNAAIGHFSAMLFANSAQNSAVLVEGNVFAQDGTRGGVRAYGSHAGLRVAGNLISDASPPMRIEVTEGVEVVPYDAGAAVGASW
jgi:parallel beta helix pectate lyase-like protein